MLQEEHLQESELAPTNQTKQSGVRELSRKQSRVRFANPLCLGGGEPGGFPNRGVSQIVSRTLSGLFLVAAVNRPRKRKRRKSGKSPHKSGKSRKNREGPKKDKKGRTSPDRDNPLFESPPVYRPLIRGRSPELGSRTRLFLQDFQA